MECILSIYNFESFKTIQSFFQDPFCENEPTRQITDQEGKSA